MRPEDPLWRHHWSRDMSARVANGKGTGGKYVYMFTRIKNVDSSSIRGLWFCFSILAFNCK